MKKATIGGALGRLLKANGISGVRVMTDAKTGKPKVLKLLTAPKQNPKICAGCRGPIRSAKGIVRTKDGALYHGRCFNS